MLTFVNYFTNCCTFFISVSLGSLDRYAKFLIQKCIMPEKVAKVRRRGSSSMSSQTIDDVELEVLRQNITNRHKQVIQDIDSKLDKIFDDFVLEINNLSLKRFDVEKLFDNGDKSKAKPTKQRKAIKHERTSSDPKQLPPLRKTLPEKEFQARNSMLTDLFEIKHIKTIYHIFIVIFNLLLLNVFFSDFISTGRINIGLGPIRTGFAGFQYAIGTWAYMQLLIFAVYPAFKLWTIVTQKFFIKKGFLTSVWHFFGILTYIACQLWFVVSATWLLVYHPLGQASSVSCLMELVRFLMKSHAFIRTNVPRVLNSKKKIKVDDSDLDSGESKNSSVGTSRVNDKRPLPTLQHFLYFLFAPTLVYRDEYPRTKHIRWGFVLKSFAEVISVIFILSFISERIMYPVFRQFGSQFYEIGIEELVASIFNSMLPSLLCFLCGFYCILHSWMNAFAEMLRFSDRMFYR